MESPETNEGLTNMYRSQIVSVYLVLSMTLAPAKDFLGLLLASHTRAQEEVFPQSIALSAGSWPLSLAPTSPHAANERLFSYGPFHRDCHLELHMESGVIG